MTLIATIIGLALIGLLSEYLCATWEEDNDHLF